MTEFHADLDLVEMVESFFSARVDHDFVLAAESNGTTGHLWDEVAALELPWIGVDDSHGGSGGTFADQIAVQMAAARHATPLPLAETYVASATLAAHDVMVTERGPATIVDHASDQLILHGEAVSGVLSAVPWVGTATSLLAIVDDTIRPALVVLDLTSEKTPAGRDLAGQPVTALQLDQAPAHIIPTTFDSVKFLRARLALVRAAQMAGAMRGVRDLTTEYVRTRSQFGRPLAAFQAVQRLVVEVAEWELLTRIAVEAAVSASADEVEIASLSAKHLANSGARAVIAAAHQAHGAIGMTQEYSLQDLSRRLNLWRGEHGTDRDLSLQLGSAVTSRRSLYRTIVEPGGRSTRPCRAV